MHVDGSQVVWTFAPNVGVVVCCSNYMVAIAREVPRAVDTTGWLTREQASDMLGVAVSTIAHWARTGQIAEERARRGHSVRLVAVYNPEDLVRMPRKAKQPIANEAGELNARVVEMLGDGKTVPEIVVATRETIERISSIREAWLDVGGADLVLARTAKAELERFVGPFATVGELVQRVAAKLGQTIAPIAAPATEAP